MPGMPPDLERVVQNMLNKGETEENIQSVISHYKQVHSTQKPDTYKGPTDWMGGFMDSLTNGEAMDAINKSTSGYMSGLADIPGNIASGIGNLASMQFNAMTDPNYIPDTIKSGMEALPSVPGRIKGALGDIGNTISQAGSNPEAFGRMDANLTATPLATEAAGAVLPKVVPSVNTVGRGLETVGAGIAKYKPFSGLLPNFADIRTLRNIEGWAGGKIRDVGSRMAIPTRMGEVVTDAPDFNEGAIIDNTKRLPESNKPFYGKESYEAPPINDLEGDFGPIIGGYGDTLTDAINPAADPLQGMGYGGSQKLLPPSPVSQYLPESSISTSRFEQPARIIGNQNSPAMPHGIPEATIPDTVKMPQKNVTPQMVAYAKKKGYTFVGYDSQGNLILKVPQVTGP